MRSIKKKTPLRRRHRPAGMDGELFRRTFDRHPWAMLLLEPPKMDGDWADAVVVAVNQAGEKLMGLSRDQLTGKKWGSVRPEDAQWLNGKRSILVIGKNNHPPGLRAPGRCRRVLRDLRRNG
jgi:PAS domain-containing protein